MPLVLFNMVRNHLSPKALLQNAGFDVVTAKESHLCCGSAGVYNVLQPGMAQQLQERKINHLNNLSADVIVAGNLGCINQLAEVEAPIMHTMTFDWAYGGKTPDQLPQTVTNSR